MLNPRHGLSRRKRLVFRSRRKNAHSKVGAAVTPVFSEVDDVGGILRVLNTSRTETGPCGPRPFSHLAILREIVAYRQQRTGLRNQQLVYLCVEPRVFLPGIESRISSCVRGEKQSR